MKLLHIADIHLGKRVGEYSMLEDQRHILSEVADIAVREGVAGVLVAGDVYDRPVPSQEATVVLSAFLSRLAAKGISVFMIAGNHDSAERLSFCNTLLSPQGVHVASAPSGRVECVTLGEGADAVHIHMLSYARPATLRPFLGADVDSEETAFSRMLAGADLTKKGGHILLAHTFVTGGETSESEQVVVGTVDSVPAAVFEKFDYVAMGHLHRPQTVGENVRYAGSPLCYSASEMDKEKSVTLIETAGGALSFREVPLHPIRAMRRVRGPFAELMEGEYSEDYIHAVVTDEDVFPDARISLRTVYPNLIQFSVENSRKEWEAYTSVTTGVESRNPLDLFAEFYYRQNGVEADGVRLSLMKELLEAALKGEKCGEDDGKGEEEVAQ